MYCTGGVRCEAAAPLPRAGCEGRARRRRRGRRLRARAALGRHPPLPRGLPGRRVLPRPELRLRPPRRARPRGRRRRAREPAGAAPRTIAQCALCGGRGTRTPRSPAVRRLQHGRARVRLCLSRGEDRRATLLCELCDEPDDARADCAAGRRALGVSPSAGLSEARAEANKRRAPPPMRACVSERLAQRALFGGMAHVSRTPRTKRPRTWPQCVVSTPAVVAPAPLVAGVGHREATASPPASPPPRRVLSHSLNDDTRRHRARGCVDASLAGTARPIPIGGVVLDVLVALDEQPLTGGVCCWLDLRPALRDARRCRATCSTRPTIAPAEHRRQKRRSTTISSDLGMQCERDGMSSPRTSTSCHALRSILVSRRVALARFTGCRRPRSRAYSKMTVANTYILVDSVECVSASSSARTSPADAPSTPMTRSPASARRAPLRSRPTQPSAFRARADVRQASRTRPASIEPPASRPRPAPSRRSTRR